MRRYWIIVLVLVLGASYLTLVGITEHELVPRCEKPIHFTVAPDTFSSAGLLNGKMIKESAINASLDWNEAVGKDLFEYLPYNSVLGQSGLIGIVMFKPQEVSEKRDEGTVEILARTSTARDGDGIVSSFIVEFYSNEINNPYSVLLHEFGHARGLEGHSDNPDDIMFATYNSSINTLSQGDIQAMKDYCDGL